MAQIYDINIEIIPNDILSDINKDLLQSSEVTAEMYDEIRGRLSVDTDLDNEFIDRNIKEVVSEVVKAISPLNRRLQEPYSETSVREITFHSCAEDSKDDIKEHIQTFMRYSLIARWLIYKKIDSNLKEFSLTAVYAGLRDEAMSSLVSLSLDFWHKSKTHPNFYARQANNI